VPEFVFTPAVEKLEHFSSMAGTKEKDATIVTQKSGTVKITMEEITKRNLGLMLMGDVDDANPDNIEIDIFSRTALQGRLKFYATNDVGPRWRVDLLRVQFTPSGDFSPIGEAIMQMQITGDVYAVDGDWGKANLVTPGAPENITIPFITGDNVEGETLTVSNGGWIDADSFSYQWKKAGVDIVGATDKTYVVASGDDTITCAVTGTNEDGSSAPVVSEAVEITT
jgi:hypothetical protein